MKKLKIFFTVVIVLGIGAFAGWKYVNKGRIDNSNDKPVITYSVNELITKLDTDTTALSPYKNKMVAVHGQVKSVSKQQDAITLELGDSTMMSSIVCQIDDRYLNDFKQIEAHQEVSLKGMMTYDMDDLGMGNTIHLDNCTRYNK